MKNNKASKKTAAKQAQVKAHDPASLARFRGVAEHVVSPGEFKSSLAPSLCPSRAGAVTYPVVLDITGMDSFAIVVQPDLTTPIAITHGAAIVESNNTISGSYQKPFTSDQCGLNAEQGCHVASAVREGLPSIPFSSTAGCTVTVNTNIQDGTFDLYNVQWRYLLGVNWTSLGTAVSLRPGAGDTTVHSASVLPAGVTALAVGVSPVGKPVDFACDAQGTYSIVFNAGTATCADVVRQGVFDVFQPQWSKVLDVSDKISIPYMDALVTFQGSALNNQGAIAVCSASEELEPLDDDYYAAIASRPFDKYEGRLASMGETEGGAHWHLLHDDIRAYSLTYAGQLVTGPRGYFGIKGMDPTMTCRLIVNVVLNYYTLDPSFAMSFQPPWGETDLLLHALRTEVPICSSNDSHAKKVLKLVRRSATRAARWATENPEKAVSLALMAGEGAAGLL